MAGDGSIKSVINVSDEKGKKKGDGDGDGDGCHLLGSLGK